MQTELQPEYIHPVMRHSFREQPTPTKGTNDKMKQRLISDMTTGQKESPKNLQIFIVAAKK
jgi:hypothetical protein